MLWEKQGGWTQRGERRGHARHSRPVSLPAALAFLCPPRGRPTKELMPPKLLLVFQSLWPRHHPLASLDRLECPPPLSPLWEGSGITQ